MPFTLDWLLNQNDSSTVDSVNLPEETSVIVQFEEVRLNYSVVME